MFLKAFSKKYDYQIYIKILTYVFVSYFINFFQNGKIAWNLFKKEKLIYLKKKIVNYEKYFF